MFNALLSFMLAHGIFAEVPTFDLSQSFEILGKVSEQKLGIAGTVKPVLESTDHTVILHGLEERDEDELLRLAGATIRVFGRALPLEPSPHKHILVHRYEITNVGRNQRPVVGHIARLQRDAEETLLFVDEAGNATMLPKGWADKRKHLVGAKVWIVFSTTASGTKPERKPERFGLLRSGISKTNSNPAN